MHRFYVPPERISDDHVSFTSDQRKQIRNVLRLAPGDLVAVFDGSRSEYRVRIDCLDPDAVMGSVLDASIPNTEPSLHLVLAQALPKGDRIEFILQKCTETGVSEFMIFESARSVPRISADKMERRLERWRAIVREASEQSGRTRLPTVRGIFPFSKALSETAHCDMRLLAWEEASGATLRDVAAVALDSAVCFVGPEGGFTPEEVSAAKQAGVSVISLGRRTLRTETAAVVASSLLIYASD